MTLFLAKKIIGTLLMPINIVLLLLLIALLTRKSHQEISTKCLCFGFFILLISAMPITSNNFIAPLEYTYPSYQKSSKNVDFIILLGCAHTSSDKLPSLSELKICSLQRLAEGLRIYQMHPEATIITSGFKGKDIMSNAEKVKWAAMSLGIPEHKLIMENYPQDTEEEAQLIAPRIVGSNAILVTNANHMPRAINYFNQYGATPTPAPTGYWVKSNNQTPTWKDFVPNTTSLSKTTAAWYETLGIIAQWFKKLF